ncbi:ABC transporter ATP-binding protein [Paradesulfitobacterium aromaticivorans]
MGARVEAIQAVEDDTQTKPVIEMLSINKSFGSVLALDDVTFTLGAGEIRALVGENGAGKSTLMNILYGMYRQDSGRIFIQGSEVPAKWSPRLAIEKGIGMIHQHFSLIANHTVLENIVMPTLKWRDIFPQWKKAEQEITKIIAEYGFQVRLRDRVETLSIGEQQQVEILKALYQGAKVLILDEPTGVLTPQQAESLLKFLVNLKNRGYSVVLVTHKLAEAMEICDNITVLRGGKHVDTVSKLATTPQEIARMMVDRDWITPLRSQELPAGAEPVLEATGLTVNDENGQVQLEDVSLTVAAGEILGVAGVAGNGQNELAETLVGLHHPRSGDLRMGGQNITKWSVGKRRLAGMGYIPEDRHTVGMVSEMSVAENLVLDMVNQEPYSRYGFVQSRVIDEKASEAIRAYTVKTNSADTPIGNLSGGNQQKVIMARTMLGNPKLIIACQPTRGLDFTATEYVHKKLLESAQNGVGVILVSSDLDELLELSHTVIVMYHGKVVGRFRRDEVDLDRLGLMMAGVGIA